MFLTHIPADLFIAVCRLIRKNNIEAETGAIWRSKYYPGGEPADDGYFLMGIGVNPDKPLAFLLADAVWDDCYFAKELPAAPFSTTAEQSAEQIRERLSNLLG